MVKMTRGECRRTSAGVMYCYTSLGTRFCPVGTTDAESCERMIKATGDRRKGRWRRERVHSESED